LKNKINFMTFILGFYERMYFEQLSGEDVDYYNERIRHFENGDYKGAIKIDLDALKLSLM